MTNSNVLLVQFVSDQSVTSDGFIALYSSVPRGYSVQPGSRVHSLPTVPRLVPAPAATRKPITTTTTEAPITTTTTATSRRRPPANPNQPARPPSRRPESGRPDPVRPGERGISHFLYQTIQQPIRALYENAGHAHYSGV